MRPNGSTSTTGAPTPGVPATGVPHLGYRAELDGIRALAVAGVLAYHARFEWAQGGFLGVSAFFTLSGFLVTTLLLEQHHATGRVALGPFWLRRFRRLLPAAWLTVAAVVALAVAGWWDGDQLRALRLDVPAALGGILNWHYVLAGRTYGAGFQAPSPLEHLWSLAVEQQFYVVFPLVAAGALGLGRALRRHGRHRRPGHHGPPTLAPLAAVSLAGLAGSALLNHRWARTDPAGAYFATATRLAELLAGVLLAIALLHRPVLHRGPVRRTLAALGLAALPASLGLWHVARVGSPWLAPWGLLASAALTVVLIAGALQPGPLRRLLSVRPLVRLGVLSYAVYLVHWPVYLVLSPARLDWRPETLFALRLSVTLLAALLVHELVEEPVRRGRVLRRAATPVAFGAASSIVAVSLVVSAGAPPPTAFRTAAGPAAVNAAAPPLRVLVLGDELAAGAAALSLGGPVPLHVEAEAAPGCGLAAGGFVRLPGGEVERDGDRCGDVRRRWSQRLDQARPEVVLVWAGLRDVTDRRLDASTPWMAPGDAVLDDFLAVEVGTVLDEAAAHGARVAVLGVPPLATTSMPAPVVAHLPTAADRRATVEEQNRIMAEGVPPPGQAANDPERVGHWNELLRRVAASRGVPFLDVPAFVASWPGGPFDPARRAPDGVGLTPLGATELAGWLAPQLQRLSAPVAPAAGPPAEALRPGDPPPAPEAGPRRAVPPEVPPTVLVLGDSVAHNYWEALDGSPVPGAGLRAVNGSTAGCPVARGGARRFKRDVGFFAAECDWATAVPQLVADQRPDVVVIAPTVWDVVDRRFPGDDRWRHVGAPEVDGYLRREYAALVDLASSAGATVVLLTAPHVRVGLDQGYVDLPESEPARIDRLNELIREVAAARPAVTRVVDLGGWMASLPGGEHDPAVRDDGVHLTRAFLPALAAWLAPQLVAIARGG